MQQVKKKFQNIPNEYWKSQKSRKKSLMKHVKSRKIPQDLEKNLEGLEKCRKFFYETQ